MMGAIANRLASATSWRGAPLTGSRTLAGSPTDMSDQPAGAGPLAMTTAAPLRRELSTPTVIAAVGVGVILVIAGIGAALRGPWLDEFWTLELSDTRNGLAALIREG